jgi:CRISPR-associated protein Cmr6
MAWDSRNRGRPPRKPERGRRPGGGRGGPPTWSQTRRPLPKPFHDEQVLPWRPPPEANLGLWLDKLVPLDQNDWSLGKDLRSYVLGQMFCKEWHSTAGARALARQREYLQGASGTVMNELTARVEGRLIVDQGRASTIETTLSFHHTWGIPRIPGSAVKGLVREAMSDEPTERLDRLFGVDQRASSLPASAGAITFFDALPDEGRFRLDLDVLTPHYQRYYQGSEPPADWHSPVPHTFLTVVDTRFVFNAVAAPAVSKDELDAVREALVEALEWFGVGGKRAAGYGRLVEG